ncbi:MAG: peptidase [Polaromonas sp.]|jgi:S1-C subfamily serine protease|nr:peptidase [Polaromonas sp.]
MRRPALYSSSSRSGQDAQPHDDELASTASSAQADPGSGMHERPAAPGRVKRALSHLSLRNIYFLWSVVGLLAVLLALSFSASLQKGSRKLTQDDINAAVLKTLETTVLPSAAARAYQTIAPSVVRVVAVGKDNAPPASGTDAKKGVPKGEHTEYGERSVGTGVVIVDKGIILTNLHVVQGADTIRITFADGLETTATITGAQPENDLAVLQAHKIPDDMIAATMRSTADLRPGDEVMAVGYPFGIGPSASAGVISGLKRNFRSPEGKQEMTNLIQFDAAANPGNSGGPLVTMDGEVIGIVTAIYNPNQQRSFVGIGFAVPIENAASAAGMPPF